MDIRDFLRKVDSIQNKEQMKEDVKRIHVKEASQVMLYGDTPEDMNAIAQIFKNAGVTPPAPVEGPKPEPEAEEISATEEVPGKATTTPNPTYKDTKYMTKDLSGGANGPKKMYKKEYPGDNPMAVEDTITEADLANSLRTQYEGFKQAYQEAAKVAETKAKPDYIDLDKDGNKTEPMKKAAKDKEAKEKK